MNRSMFSGFLTPLPPTFPDALATPTSLERTLRSFCNVLHFHLQLFAFFFKLIEFLLYPKQNRAFLIARQCCLSKYELI